MAPMKLYYAIMSPPSRSALLTIRNLGIDVECVEINMAAGEHRKEPFLRINPKGCVPTLVDDDFTLWESKAILIYLCQSLKGFSSMYPKDAKTRALINQRLFNDASSFYVKVLDVSSMVFTGTAIITPKHKENLKNVLQTLENFLEGNEYFVGNHVTLADMAFLGSVSTLIHFGYNISNFTNLSGWYERCRSLPGFDECEEGAKAFGGFVRGKLQNSFDD